MNYRSRRNYENLERRIFDGVGEYGIPQIEPVTYEGGAVAVSSVGVMNSKEKKALFLAGYEEMVRRLRPETIIFCGSVPDECMGNVVRVRAFAEKFKEAKCDGW